MRPTVICMSRFFPFHFQLVDILRFSFIYLVRLKCCGCEGLWEQRLSKFTKRDVNQEAVIRGKVCRINEAEEPSEILWENIDATLIRRCLGE